MYFNWVIPSLIRTWKHTKTSRHNIATVSRPAASQLASVPTSPGTCWVYHQQMHYLLGAHREGKQTPNPFPAEVHDCGPPVLKMQISSCKRRLCRCWRSQDFHMFQSHVQKSTTQQQLILSLPSPNSVSSTTTDVSSSLASPEANLFMNAPIKNRTTRTTADFPG